MLNCRQIEKGAFLHIDKWMKTPSLCVFSAGGTIHRKLLTLGCSDEALGLLASFLSQDSGEQELREPGSGVCDIWALGRAGLGRSVLGMFRVLEPLAPQRDTPLPTISLLVPGRQTWAGEAPVGPLYFGGELTGRAEGVLSAGSACEIRLRCRRRV